LKYKGYLCPLQRNHELIEMIVLKRVHKKIKYNTSCDLIYKSSKRELRNGLPAVKAGNRNSSTPFNLNGWSWLFLFNFILYNLNRSI
jgi:hypothetical protein